MFAVKSSAPCLYGEKELGYLAAETHPSVRSSRSWRRLSLKRFSGEACGVLGAPPEKIHRNPYGVDYDLFQGATPATVPPTLVAMGRFVKKKCPLVTISALAAVHRAMPAARE